MMQYDLFSPPPAKPETTFLDFMDEDKDPWGLRWYQREAYDAIFAAFARGVESLLVVAATGTGKTQMFSAVAGNWVQLHGSAVLVLAHRDELVQQARDRLEQMTGLQVEVEQGDWRASSRAQIVVGSTDSVMRQARLDRFGKDRFGLVIPDEAHGYVAATRMRILNFFQAKKLGVTATPDRADEKALGQAFDEVAYVFDILEGIDNGYLVPIEGQRVTIEEMQLDGIDSKTSKDGKDLAAAQLDVEVVKHVEKIVAGTMKYAPERQAIGFFPGVKSAEYAAAKFNEREPGSTAFVSGETDKMLRRSLIREYRAGKLKRLCNCDVFTEGFDAPETSLIINGAPTLSRAKYAQRVGRGTRPFGANVDGLPGKEQGAERRALIAASSKPNMLILDFVGSSTKHALVSPEDLLGGNYSEAEVATAKKKRAERGGDIRGALEEARRELKAAAARISAKVAARAEAFNPFQMVGVTDYYLEMDRFDAPMTVGQRGALEKIGLTNAEMKRLSKRTASKMLGEFAKRRDKGLASYGQLRKLAGFGITDKKLTFQRASMGLDYVASTGWGKREKIDPKKLNDILYRVRVPGED